VIDPSDPGLGAGNVLARLPAGLSRFDAPPTVRVSASRRADGSEITLHFVNYNREETKGDRGVRDEKPVAAMPCQVDLGLGPDRKVARLEFLTPEAENPDELQFETSAGRVRFRVPGYLVYGVVRVRFQPRR
jgi:hypothetical protein